jgi:hypothetical protein
MLGVSGLAIGVFKTGALALIGDIPRSIRRASVAFRNPSTGLAPA